MANQILAGAVINAGMVIAGVDADNPPYVGPPPSYNLFRSGSGGSYVYELHNADDDSATPLTFTSNTAATTASNGRYLALGRNDGFVEVYDLLDLSAAPRVTNPADAPPGATYWGYRVAMNSDKLFVSGLFGPEVKVYDLSDMSIVNTITCPDNEDFRFGQEIACNSTHLFVGHPYGRQDPNDNMTEAGKVWVYDLSDFSVENILYPIDGEYYDQFGTTIKLSDTHLAISAHGDDETNGHNQNIGAVYLYELSDLSGSVIKIDAPIGAQEWGRTMDLSNTHLAVSSTNYNVQYNSGGIVNIFTISTLSSSLTPTYTMHADQAGDQLQLIGLIGDNDKISVREKISYSGPNIRASRVYLLSDLSTHISESVDSTFLIQIPPYVAPPPPPQNYFQASLSDWTIVAGSVSEPDSGTFAWTRDGGSGWVAGYEVSGLTVGTEYTISYEMRKTGGPGPVEMRITPAVGGGATLTNNITESSDFVTFTSTWTQPNQTTAYVNIISDNGGGSGEIRSVSIVG